MRDISATWMRGGTSKCWVFDADDLRVDGRTADEVLLRLYGSPDPRQIDGVGGATSTTSKAVVLARSTRDDADVDYISGMIPHHQQAIEMSRMAFDHAQSPEVKKLAEQIQAAQGPEIDKLTGWLQSWGAEAPSGMPGMDHGGHSGHSGSGGGMMSPEEMGQDATNYAWASQAVALPVAGS